MYTDLIIEALRQSVADDDPHRVVGVEAGMLRQILDERAASLAALQEIRALIDRADVPQEVKHWLDEVEHGVE